jgi:hypothetical protein
MHTYRPSHPKICLKKNERKTKKSEEEVNKQQHKETLLSFSSVQCAKELNRQRQRTKLETIEKKKVLEKRERTYTMKCEKTKTAANDQKSIRKKIS